MIASITFFIYFVLTERTHRAVVANDAVMSKHRKLIGS